jgi:hypothetical protein
MDARMRRQGRQATAAADAGRWWPELAADGAAEAVHRPTSEVLAGLLRDSTAEHVTLAWVVGGLRERSFGIILLVLAVVGMLPGVATLTGLLLLFPAFQMIVARRQPVLPARIGSRRFRTRRVERMLGRTSRLLAWLERFAYPRWTMPSEVAKRVIGGVVMLLAISLLSPLPFAQIIPNLVIILIAFSFLEKDGLLLSVALVLAPISLAISTAAIWVTFAATGIF